MTHINPNLWPEQPVKPVSKETKKTDDSPYLERMSRAFAIAYEGARQQVRDYRNGKEPKLRSVLESKFETEIEALLREAQTDFLKKLYGDNYISNYQFRVLMKQLESQRGK